MPIPVRSEARSSRDRRCGDSYAFVAGQDDGTLTFVSCPLGSGDAHSSPGRQGRQWEHRGRRGSVRVGGEHRLSGGLARRGFVARCVRSDSAPCIRQPSIHSAVGWGSLWVSEYLPPAVSRVKSLWKARALVLKVQAQSQRRSLGRWQFGGGALRRPCLRSCGRGMRAASDRRGASGRAQAHSGRRSCPGDSALGFGSAVGGDGVRRTRSGGWILAREKPSAIINVPAGAAWALPRDGARCGSRATAAANGVRASIPTRMRSWRRSSTGYFPQYVAAAGGFVWVRMRGETAFGESGNGYAHQLL